MEHIKSAEHQLKLLGKQPPEELTNLRESESKMDNFSWMIFGLWADCQRWDCAGKIRIETLKELAPDHGFKFDQFIRGAVSMIENTYRQVQAEKARSKNG